MHSVRLSFFMLVIRCLTTAAAEPEDAALHGRKILATMGARLENSGTPERLASYEAIFSRLDTNRDGWLNRQEFVEDGRYLTRQARQGIFRASDSDQDGFVSHDEYVVNRVITDEAKQLFHKMDQDQDSAVTNIEFVAGAGIADQDLAADVFEAFDTDSDRRLRIPEYLRVWGQWAREAPVVAKLIVKQDTYVLPRTWQGESFGKRIQDEQDGERLPAAPKVNLVLELHNTGDEPVMIWPAGNVDEPALTVRGPGVVMPESLQSFSAASSTTTPQPVIWPGKRHQMTIESLNPGGFSLDNVYWTKAGQYTIAATYPVWKNLPPHLPQLFGQPEPKGPPIKFLVRTPPCTVNVVAEQ